MMPRRSRPSSQAGAGAAGVHGSRQGVFDVAPQISFPPVHWSGLVREAGGFPGPAAEPGTV